MKRLVFYARPRRARNREKLERVMLYGQSAAFHWRLLHDYFGEEMQGEQCGTCDNCLQPLEEQFGLTNLTARLAV